MASEELHAVYVSDSQSSLSICLHSADIGRLAPPAVLIIIAKLGNAGLIRDKRYRIDPDAGMPLPD